MYKLQQLGPYPQKDTSITNTNITVAITGAFNSTLQTLFPCLDTTAVQDDLVTQTTTSISQTIGGNLYLALGVALPIASLTNQPYFAAVSGHCSPFSPNVSCHPFLAKTNLNVLTAGYDAQYNASTNFQLLPLCAADRAAYSVNTASLIYPELNDDKFLIAGFIYSNTSASAQTIIPAQSITLHRYFKDIQTADAVR